MNFIRFKSLFLYSVLYFNNKLTKIKELYITIFIIKKHKVKTKKLYKFEEFKCS